MASWDALALGMAWARLVLGQAGGATTWLEDLRTWGPPGLGLALVLVGIMVPKYVVDRLDRDLARVIQQRDDLVAQQAEVIPVLSQVVPTLNGLQAAMAAQTRELAEVRAELRRLQGGPRARGTGG